MRIERDLRLELLRPARTGVRTPGRGEVHERLGPKVDEIDGARPESARSRGPRARCATRCRASRPEAARRRKSRPHVIAACNAVRSAPSAAAAAWNSPRPSNPPPSRRAGTPLWERRGYFAAGLDAGKPAFCIQLPPPNVTGTLHMGHAFNQTIMDALTRYHRMRGLQHAVAAGHRPRRHRDADRRRAPARRSQGTSRHDLGRENFVEQVWDGRSSRGRPSRADAPPGRLVRLDARVLHDGRRSSRRVVTETFVRLYEEGLIYRGKRLVNWDPVLQYRRLRPRGGERGGRRLAVAHPLPVRADGRSAACAG